MEAAEAEATLHVLLLLLWWRWPVLGAATKLSPCRHSLSVSSSTPGDNAGGPSGR
jgi:hypothetical protein